MSVSVVDSIDRSVKWVKHILFDEFSLAKWFVLGFCAFLAMLGEGGAANFPTQVLRFKNHSRGASYGAMDDWVRMHLGAVILIGGGILLIAIAIGLLFTWLSSRGKFMFLDGVVRNREAVVEPWHRFRVLGNSLFFFRIVLGIVSFFAFGALIAGSTLLLLPAIRVHRMTLFALLVVVLAGAIFLFMAVALALVMAVLKDFVVPVMYRRELKTVPAFRVFLAEFLPGHILAFILFYLLKFVLGIAAGVIMVVGTCLTCCIAAIPYINSVVFLPILVFFRCYSVYFLEQFGPEWRFFEADKASEPVPAGSQPEKPAGPESPKQED